VNLHTRVPDLYEKPRYPVDIPPTFRARCTCGWTGPSRYKDVVDRDWQDHLSVQVAAEVQDGVTATLLREQVLDAIAASHDRGAATTGTLADAVMQTPAIRDLLGIRARVAALADDMDTTAEVARNDMQQSTVPVNSIHYWADRLRTL
jgi:hypothetical protein